MVEVVEFSPQLTWNYKHNPAGSAQKSSSLLFPRMENQMLPESLVLQHKRPRSPRFGLSQKKGSKTKELSNKTLSLSYPLQKVI